ncbi:MFS transporter [Nocardia sp. NPDC058058]|uniref:MFS transporter n=1 Tax=Nocardia sp. NPDC058058 TaxID=3346317 RepID=UPI0036D810E5
MFGSTVLRNRDFVLLWTGNAVSHIGLQGVRIAYPLLTLILTDSPISASIVAFAIALPGLIFEIPAGVAADLWDRRQTLMLCQRVGLTATLIALLVITVRPPGLTVFLAVAAFAEGSAYVFFQTSELVLVRDVVTESDRAAAFSFLEVQQPIANMMGRILGAATLGLARGLPFLTNAASYLYCLWTLSRIRSQGQRAPKAESIESESIWDWQQARIGIRSLWSDQFARETTLLIGATNAIIQTFILLLTLEIRASGHSAWAVGLVLGASGLGGVLSAIPAAALSTRIPVRIALLVMLWGWALLFILMVLTSNTVILTVCWMGVGFLAAIGGIPLTLYRVRAFPDAIIGRILGAHKLIAHGGTALGALASGWLISTLGTATVGWVLIVVMMLLARRARRLPEPQPPAAVRSRSPVPPATWIVRVSRNSGGMDNATGRSQS